MNIKQTKSAYHVIRVLFVIGSVDMKNYESEI